MKRLGQQKAIEPDAILMPSRQPSVYQQVRTPFGYAEKYQPEPTGNPSPLMMRLGFTRNPRHCSHVRKRMTAGIDGWRCLDCGTRV